MIVTPTSHKLTYKHTHIYTHINKGIYTHTHTHTYILIYMDTLSHKHTLTEISYTGCSLIIARSAVIAYISRLGKNYGTFCTYYIWQK